MSSSKRNTLIFAVVAAVVAFLFYRADNFWGLVIAGLILYDFATGTKKQSVTVQKTLPETGTDTGLSKPEATPPGDTSVATVDPRNETPAITGEATPAPQPEVAAAPSPGPLPFVNNPSMQPPAAPATSPGGMPALALGTTSRVDLEPVSTSSVPVVFRSVPFTGLLFALAGVVLSYPVTTGNYPSKVFCR